MSLRGGLFTCASKLLRLLFNQRFDRPWVSSLAITLPSAISMVILSTTFPQSGPVVPVNFIVRNGEWGRYTLFSMGTLELTGDKSLTTQYKNGVQPKGCFLYNGRDVYFNTHSGAKGSLARTGGARELTDRCRTRTSAKGA